MWGLTPVDNADNAFEYGTDIDSFMERMSAHGSTTYFHNLKFDGHFMLDWLLKHGYRHVVASGTIEPHTFKSLISDMGKFYSITVRWENGNTTEFRDSFKKLPFSVARVATSFGLGETKGELDYHKPRAIGYQPDEQELDYLRRDVIIVAKALKQEIDAGMTRLTVASDSLAEYKKLTGSKTFERLFPVLADSMDAEIRRAYRGGFTYADPRYKGFQDRSGLVLDVNSLYPYVMKSRQLPYGEPQWVDGRVEPTPERPLTIFAVTFTAKLKLGHIPCIQIKGTNIFAPTEYQTRIKEPTMMMVTNVDWKLYNDHYDITVLEYGGGWRFKELEGLFDNYIDKWYAVKAASTGGMREIAKLHLTSLYGKFASNPNVTSKIPTLEDGKVKLVRGKDDTRAPVYTAMGVFITSYAREITIRAAQTNYSVFAYADTDSLHLLTDDIPTDIDVHPSDIGAWKLEYRFDAAYYIRAKAYLERELDGHYHVALAGVPETVQQTLTFESLRAGTLHGKKIPKVVPGGVVLQDVPFDLKL